MHKQHPVLWLSISPSLKCFDQRLLSQLIRGRTVRRWQYCQTVDEPCSVEGVVASLHNYFSSQSELSKSEPFQSDSSQSEPSKLSKLQSSKVHLIGHGVSGVIGLLYARQYPQHVASLTLLSVGSLPAVNWQAHYYALRKLLPCSREVLLGQMTRLLFGEQPARIVPALVQLLARDLDSSLTLHSLAHSSHIPAGGVEVPLLVCNGDRDNIITAQQNAAWKRWLKPEDRLWHCPNGSHFFHFHQHKAVARAITTYWADLSPSPKRSIPTTETSIATRNFASNLSSYINQ